MGKRTILLFVCFLLCSSSVGAAQDRQTRMKEASAENFSSGLFGKNEAVERTQIDIEATSTYVSHSVNIVSAAPGPESAGKWSVSDGCVRGKDGRVEAVWVEVRAGNRDLFGDPVFIRAQLAVVVETRGIEPKRDPY